jgi:prepilin signal peptidase PulO-like enzyme (type II secretory pathway)
MDYLFVWLAALVGLLIGSFLNCLIWRLYKNETITGRSYCPTCSKMIAWYDNIPLFSFAFLLGRCRHCHKKISWQYPLVELITSVLFALVFLKNMASPDLAILLARDWLLIAAFTIVFVYDLRWQMVPMVIVWPVTGIVFILNLFLGVSWDSLILFGAIGAAFFLIQYIATKRKGLGEGDIWLGLLLGITFPSAGALALSLCLAYFFGAIIGSILLLSHKKKWKSKLALGPFLAYGAIITLIYGQEIINWYLGLL